MIGKSESHDENNTDENNNDNDENKSHDTFFLFITYIMKRGPRIFYTVLYMMNVFVT